MIQQIPRLALSPVHCEFCIFISSRTAKANCSAKIIHKRFASFLGLPFVVHAFIKYRAIILLNITGFYGSGAVIVYVHVHTHAIYIYGYKDSSPLCTEYRFITLHWPNLEQSGLSITLDM